MTASPIVRRITPADRRAATALAAAAAAEVPHFRWILGDALDADGTGRAGRTFVDLLLTAHQEDGLHGAFDDDELVGLIAWSAPGHAPGEPTVDQKASAAELFTAHPEVAERWTVGRRLGAAVPRPEESVFLDLIAMAPHARGTGLLDALLAPALRTAIERRIPVTAHTSIDRLASSHAPKWGATTCGSYTLPDDGPTVWILQLDHSVDLGRLLDPRSTRV